MNGLVGIGSLVVGLGMQCNQRAPHIVQVLGTAFAKAAVIHDKGAVGQGDDISVTKAFSGIIQLQLSDLAVTAAVRGCSRAEYLGIGH
ncbi:MAG: hypothetical protein IJV67_08230, partial [Clostridia bacterium]|nr:hypothetical protein [Clostridia bacterium]